jgi:DNA-3-methyladenine glycosylase I
VKRPVPPKPAGEGGCTWPGSDELYLRYHDQEWGRPVTDDHRLFEKICLEGFQSGLSWITILRKRDHFRQAFKGFDPSVVARFGARDVTRLLKDAGIVRHRGKIESTINNAKRALELVEERGSLAAYFWSWEPPEAARPRRLTHAQLMKMSTTPQSVALSKDLKNRGWTFVGPTRATRSCRRWAWSTITSTAAPSAARSSWRAAALFAPAELELPDAAICTCAPAPEHGR